MTNIDRERGAILMVCRNGVSLTKAAVRSALDQDVPCDLMVIDNVTSDGTAAWLRTKRIALCTLSVQHSLSACWNKGIKAFFGQGYSEVLVINNDVSIREDTYRVLVSTQLPFVTAVSVNSLSQVGQAGDKDKQLSVMITQARPHPDFSCFMIRKEVFKRVGGFEASYFPAYVEDCDYHVRMRRAGIKAVCIDLPFYHAAAQTIDKADAGERERIKRGADMNRQMFRRAYGCLPGTPEYQELFK